MKLARHITDNPIKGEIYSVERLEEYAVYLANQLTVSKNPLVSHPLLPRMRENGKKLLAAYRSMSEAIHRREAISPAAEWLTDNFHIVEDQLREIQEDLPPAFYRELPKIAIGELAGYPRVYAIALAIVAHTDSQLESETLQKFIEAYQTVTPLNIGELWAVAITLRLVLVENLSRLAVNIEVDHEKRNGANEFADKLFTLVGEKDQFQAQLLKLPAPINPAIEDDCAYLAQLAKRLRDQESELWPALEQLENILAKENSSPEQIVHLSHQRQAANQVTVANIVTSMRLISSLDWRNFFESLSHVDRILGIDPVYSKMDFLTRDRYRHVIEQLGKSSGAAEKEIAQEVVRLTEDNVRVGTTVTSAESIKKAHVGYFLISTGFKQLKEKFKFKFKFFLNCKSEARLLDFSLAHPNLIYFASIGFSLAVTCIWPLYYAEVNGAPAPLLIGIGLLVAIPCSDLALSITNLILTHVIRPKRLPKLDLSSGIPQDARTMVIIPSMLCGKQVIAELLEKLEIHYLGNSDHQLFFALLTDFTDGAEEFLPEDEGHVEAAIEGILCLNKKYSMHGEEKFFLFHRRRLWNECECAWMGWERKRGKIHEFNRLLRGATDTSFDKVIAPTSLLATIRFVITLDADTQLPRDSARKLVGTILHPLNQPNFDKTLGRVTDGYGILQPRIGISLESSGRSLFSKIFSGYTGIDPYTTAVSEVYQDLFQEGSFTGKGLYDVDAFQASLADRCPENTVLSHDLFEGLYARSALLTDVELLDDYPRTYHAFFTRQHRWTRGDWQIATWILPFVKNSKRQWVRNHLPLISRWKILDNLRRSLVAPSTFLWLILSFAILPGAPVFWMLYVFFIIAFPSMAQVALGALAMRFGNHSLRISATGVKTRLNVFQPFLYLTFLAHQSYIQVDAIVRVTFRQLITNKKLLEWTTAAHIENEVRRQAQKPIWQKTWPTEILLTGIAISIALTHPENLLTSILLVSLWLAFPLVERAISQKLIKQKKTLNGDDQDLMRQIARRTWNYFETFVGLEDNFLPPDNHQIFPEPVTAHRTSPTNIGLYILSLVSARDFGYVSTNRFLPLLGSTLTSMKKLERYEGHYLNWYDTRNLQALEPKYVSTVDSGNLAGYLLVGKQACLEIPECHVFDEKIIHALGDILSIIESELRDLGDRSHELLSSYKFCRALLTTPSPHKFSEWILLLRELITSFDQAKKTTLAANIDKADIEKIIKWTDLGIHQLHEAESELLNIAPWCADQFHALGVEIAKYSISLETHWNELIQVLDQNLPLSVLVQSYEIALHKVRFLLDDLANSPVSMPSQAHEKSKTSNSYEISEISLTSNLIKFIESLRKANNLISELLQTADATAILIEQEFKVMNFDFLLDQERGVFTIGYNVTAGQFDSGLYDLLASESRLASFIAIAKADVPQEHWFRLGRQLVPIGDQRALISWTASMFEYLMPLLVLRDYENTLLSETMQTVVARQVKYGKENHVPWGVSEAGYNARDLQLNYQYGPFGVPGLGLKRGLSHDLVISPYSTLLAAIVDPTASIENIRVLISHKLLADCGFYESVDYTATRLPENQKFAVIKSFMAHHQGMSMVAINNVLNHNSIQDRFHNDPRIRATRLLLQERIPQGVVPVLPKAAEIELEGEQKATAMPLVRTYTDPDKHTPRIQLLSNRTYSIMISTAGAGYSKCDGLAVTRWKEDATLDNWGSFIFIRDHAQDAVWSTTYQPFAHLPDSYRATLGEDKVEFRRRDGDISTYTEILVAPEDNVEIRHVTLTNHSDEPRDLELTSYLEPVLGPMRNDLDHMAFSKLFIQTEFLESKNALLAKRRKRSETDTENWGLHVVVTDAEMFADVQYETDRARFIGRGRTLVNALALFEGKNLSNSTSETFGATLDPIMSLRVRVRIPANSKAQVAFTTGFASSHDEALELADRYHDIHSFDRESKLAWMKSQADLKHIGIDSNTAYLFQRLAERILYSEPTLRPPAHQRMANTNVQSSLWPSGISGDIPIVAVRIDELRDIATIRKLLRCHEYLRMKGLVYDFVILNNHEAAYFQGLQDDLLWQIRTSGCHALLNKPGGVFVLRKDIMHEKDIAHLFAVARVSLSADEPLKEQITRKALDQKYPEPLAIHANAKTASTRALPTPDLMFFNGIGGFSGDGREYVTTLKDRQWTPAPWINVVGNSLGFGFQVSEAGSGFTWSQNSQTNRLTPWSNDPVSDPAGEVIYIRDDESGEIWTPTPLPIRGESSYIIRHGQGYTKFEHSDHGIDHKLTLFVPENEPVKISFLELTNLTNRKRKITVTSYTEWVLGSLREKTAQYLVCEVDQISGAIFARNPHDDEFGANVGFADINCIDRTFTCSRKEFLGRNGNYIIPAALKRSGLSQKRGTGQDPCAVLQTTFELLPGERRELSFLLGQCATSTSARELTLRYRDLSVAKIALADVIESWKKITNCVQIKSPSPSMNILMNSWLIYQTLSCRFWARTAFYQSGGAYGFRDQLQDCMSFVYARPQLTREHILKAASRQFKEGDVQHWWHPPLGRGVRTRMSDDLLWLPYVISFYIEITGDKTILTELVPFLEAPLLKANEDDSYSLPQVSLESASILEHCLRAINRSLEVGQHGLPLIGTGDWNDGMNRVGALGKGESIWLGWFLYKVLDNFLPFCDQPEQKSNREKYRSHMESLCSALEKEGWDGDWYKRAYFDDGTPIGSAKNNECRIDSIAQSWAVLSGAGDPDRAKHAMDKVSELLVDNKSNLILLFTPPFNSSPKDPGYIKGYVPGVRENGGQYTHAAAWVIMAFAQIGDGKKAFELFEMINPILHSQNELELEKYRIEPYVIAGDVYSGEAHEGRGGWSWYTGSASWYYRAGLEAILGFRLRGNELTVSPCIPKTWEEYEISYLFGSTRYSIQVINPNRLSTGTVAFALDNFNLPGPSIRLADDGQSHVIVATLQ